MYLNIIGITSITIIYLQAHTCQASYDYFHNSFIMDQTNFSLSDCHYCGGEYLYDEQPPMIFIPPPPIHPDCEGFESFYAEAEQAKSSNDIINQSMPILAGFVLISGLLLIYLLFTRRARIIAALTRSKLTKANNQPLNNITLNKNSLHNSMTNSGLDITEPCYLQTNGDKNLISPIISEHASQKTSIPSNCWKQPNSIIVRTIRNPRIPNEYEVPSSTISRTVYAEMSDDQRFYSPYNMHTYAEVREAQVLL